VFPGHEPAEKHLSNMALLIALRRWGHEEITMHGFRSAFRDWAAECTSFPGDVAELCLAHVVGSETQRAYNRSDLFEKRRQLMALWADYCKPEKGHNVVKLGRISRVARMAS
jgi:integrase